MSSALRIRKPRASGPRVKTGCKTCKSRRIKCDEARPSCLKCTSSGRECEGYEPQRSGRHEFAMRDAKSYVLRGQEPQRPFQTLGGDNNAHYLELYYHFVSKAISGPFYHEFWSCISLQMAHAEPAVRHAMIALTCLYRSNAGSIKDARADFQTPGEAHRQLLIHYNKSIRHLTSRMNEASYSHNIGLATCILFICIEFFRGEYHAAFNHLMAGLKLVSSNEAGNAEVNNNNVIGEYHHALITRQHARINEGLVSVFPPLITIALLYGAPVQNVTTIAAPSPFKDKHPSTFTTLQEARLALHEAENVALFYERELQHNRYLGIETPDNVVARNATLLLEQHTHWLASFELFITRNARTFQPSDQVFIHLVKMGYWCTYISIANMLDRNMMAVDAYLPQFQTVLHHAASVLEASGFLKPQRETQPSDLNSLYDKAKDAQRPMANFTLELSIIPCVYFVANRCRCPITRRQAISYLSLPGIPREGLWDPEQYAIVARRTLEIEEAELDERGWPVEHTRLWSAVVLGNTLNKRFSARMTAGKGSATRHKTRPFGVGPGKGEEWEEWFVCD